MMERIQFLDSFFETGFIESNLKFVSETIKSLKKQQIPLVESLQNLFILAMQFGQKFYRQN